jgi:hypothetical protein
MRKVIVNEWMSLDGIAQAPGSADEDTSGGSSTAAAPALQEQVLARPLNTLPKYLVSATLSEPLAWQDSTLLRGDVAEAVHALNQEDAVYLLAVGSTRLVQTLVQHDLVDEFRLMIDPVVVGGGKRVIPDDGVLRPLRLADSSMTTTGAILATHGPCLQLSGVGPPDAGRESKEDTIGDASQAHPPGQAAVAGARSYEG